MGTEWRAAVVATPPELAPALEGSLASSIAALSQWDPNSALSRFNRAPVGEWIELDPILKTVLTAALGIANTSGGAFDPATGIPADLWGFGASGRRDAPPTDDAVTAALARSGRDGIALDGDRARRTRDVALDLSGIGKGHAVDRLAAVCRDHDCADFLIEIGGEFVGSGVRPDGQPWWVDVETPPGVSLSPLRVATHGIAVATSGDYRRYIAAGTERLGHTLDPRTGRPITNGVISVSVIASDCMTADAWATALTVLGPEAGIAVAVRERLATRIVTRDGSEVVSPALAGMLED